MDFSDKATAKNVQDYILSLFESGIDSVEIDYKSVQFLKNIDTSRKFIYRAECIPDLIAVKQKEFEYVTVPVSMLAIAQKLRGIRYEEKSDTKRKKYNDTEITESVRRIKYIIEVDGDNRTYDELLKLCKIIDEANCASAIRIVKNFDSLSTEFSDFIDRYYHSFNNPHDISPLNSDLNGIDTAYEAFAKDVNMITLSFGSPYLYTPYELFVLYFPKTLGLSPAMIFTPYLYTAAARYNAVSDSLNCGLKNLNDVIDSSKKNTVNVDIIKPPSTPRRIAVSKQKNEKKYTNAQNSFFNSNDFDSEICSDLSEALDNTDISLYNRFLCKDDFEN